MLADLHGSGDPTNGMVQLEFEEIQEQVYFERTEGAKSYFDLLKPGVLHRVSLGTSLQMWSQLSGVNLMMCVVLIFCCVDSNTLLGTTLSTYSRGPALPPVEAT